MSSLSSYNGYITLCIHWCSCLPSILQVERTEGSAWDITDKKNIVFLTPDSKNGTYTCNCVHLTWQSFTLYAVITL